MNFLPEEIELYVENHTKPESELLSKLNHETWQKVINPRMLSGHLQGRVLSMLSKMIRPKNILEIGTYTGYSALCLAEGLTEDGVLVTIDINDELQWIQDKYFLASPFGKKIERHFGNALDLIPALKIDFDIVFMDADKENYINYYNILMSRLKSGAYIFIDNVLWSGKVIKDPHPNDIETITLQKLNDLVTNDQRVENVLLPVRDGLMVLRVK
ncbi:MAG: class I SAM-dependent methyltransferase [Flavobacteriales bacterium]|nr:class I SAM-dependent methyltransferase [Flavobacteriales bacterium]